MAAAHLGMRSASVWNYWFPCFNRQFAAFSPGLILLAKIVTSAADVGIRIVELGAGDALYKDRFANTSRTLACGCAVVEHE
jgi:CelD/BcsL family acetyltransferase involved in cellulose biosynthesis